MNFIISFDKYIFACIGRNDIHKSAKNDIYFKQYFVRYLVDKSLVQKSKFNN